MLSLLLFPLFIFILPTISTFILVPLYIYPDSDASAWVNLTNTIAAYPTVQWQVIVNPNSGPGTTGYPDSNYIPAIAKLNSYPNVITLGYVDTQYTSRAISAVETDIQTYASWSGYQQADISIKGIFFDDVKNTDSTSTYTYYQTITDYAKETVSPNLHPIIFNPGTLAPAQLFSYADTIVEFENQYSNYNGQTTDLTIPQQYRSQSDIIINSTPDGADVGSIVHTIIQDGIAGVYLSRDPSYNTLDGTLLNQLAAAVQAG